MRRYFVAWGREYLAARTPELIRSLTERQRAIVQPPFVHERHLWDAKTTQQPAAAVVGPSAS